MTEPRFEVRPLTWQGPHTNPRQPARFKAKWTDTLDLLKAEVAHLGGKVIACQIDVTEGDIRRDGMLRVGAKVGFPGVKITFESRYGPLTYATDEYARNGSMMGWQANVRAIALGLQALRAVDRYGITRSGEQYRGWQAISDKPADQNDLTVEDAKLVFADALKGSDFNPEGILWNSPTWIKLAYREAVKLHHPDVTGGDGSVFRLITKARDVLLASLR